jgi:hypothetical protein
MKVNIFAKRMISLQIVRNKLLYILVFFLTSGDLAYVLPHFNNAVYVKVNIGSHFGHFDIYGSTIDEGADEPEFDFLQFKLKDLDLYY